MLAMSPILMPPIPVGSESGGAFGPSFSLKTLLALLVSKNAGSKSINIREYLRETV
jgi:hypothetical protein